jgi:CubicO group peptidase (beta-lactamase class C family)
MERPQLAQSWRAPGRAHSTAPDIARFLGYFLEPDGRFPKPETAAAMVVNQAGVANEQWGLGWKVKPGGFRRGCSARTFGHSGVTGTLAWADPAKNRIFVILTTLPAESWNPLGIKPASNLVSGE